MRLNRRVAIIKILDWEESGSSSQGGWQQLPVSPPHPPTPSPSSHLGLRSLNIQVQMSKVKEFLGSFSISFALFDLTKCLHGFSETLPDAGSLIIHEMLFSLFQ